MISAKGQTIRVATTDLPNLGRATQGVRVMRLDGGDTLASVSAVLPEEDKEEAEAPVAPAASPTPAKK